MNRPIQLAPHEALELHELIRSEVTCAKKMQASIGLVGDSDLRGFMEQSLQAKTAALGLYQQFLSEARPQH